MKNLFNINKWCVIITLILYLTIIGGLIAQILLGIIQIIMSLEIAINYKYLIKKTKKLFLLYLFLTVLAIAITCYFYFYLMNDAIILIYFSIASLALALFHLYITYRLKNEL